MINNQTGFHSPFHTNRRQGTNRMLIVPCPYCDSVYKVRQDAYKSYLMQHGQIKSCGCLTGRIRKKHFNGQKNDYYFPNGCAYGLCFYEKNEDGYFIFDIEDFHQIKRHHWMPVKRKGRKDPYAIIKGKFTLLSRWLLKTPDELVVDHINHNSNDLRKCNLRNCTREQNMCNMQRNQGTVYQDRHGRYRIKSLIYVDTRGLFFDTEKEAQQKLEELRDVYHGEFSYPASERMAKKNEVHQFSKRVCSGKLEKIEELPERHPVKIFFTDICRDWRNAKLTDEAFSLALNEVLVKYNEHYGIK